MRSEKRDRVLAVGIVPYELDLPGVRDAVVTPGRRTARVVHRVERICILLLILRG